MAKTIIVWFRNDLRIHDHPALAAAVQDADLVIPLFIFDERLLKGNHGSSNRNRFMIESLQDLQTSLQSKGADLVIREGDPGSVLVSVASETKAEAVYYSADYTPFAIKRDKAVKHALENIDVEFLSFACRLIVGTLDKLQTKSGNDYKVFTPYYKNWLEVERRIVAATPTTISLPPELDLGNIHSVSDVSEELYLSPHVLSGGETAGRKRLHRFLDDHVENYKNASNDMAADATSRLSSYLHFGCLSPLEIEGLLPDSAGAEAWRRQLCWREFYHYILYKHPANAHQEFQERYRSLEWGTGSSHLAAWQSGKTGYPIVDAAMRQLKQEGWMHNRARLIVGSFLTKDLWIDWRIGEKHFMNWLIDGDEANNNGNWQWIASVGVDPAPVFRRLYNPTLQQKNYDPSGAYVRKYVPELSKVPVRYLSEPWTMAVEMQRESECIIGKDYPFPIVDHKEARMRALENYKRATI